jgi:hypothetical protein
MPALAPVITATDPSIDRLGMYDMDCLRALVVWALTQSRLVSDRRVYLDILQYAQTSG